jgi:hypothetical protein
MGKGRARRERGRSTGLISFARLAAPYCSSSPPDNDIFSVRHTLVVYAYHKELIINELLVLHVKFWVGHSVQTMNFGKLLNRSANTAVAF